MSARLSGNMIRVHVHVKQVALVVLCLFALVAERGTGNPVSNSRAAAPGAHGQPVPRRYDAVHDVETERLSLIALFNSTGGPSWGNHSNWLCANISYCDWYGVTCAVELDINSNVTVQHVTRLDLRSNQLNGNLPHDVLCGLPRVRDLSFPLNGALSGPLPRVSCLPLLRSFSAASCSLSGPVPDFSNNTMLEEINLFNNTLSGTLPTTWINNLTNLTTISIGSNTNISGVFPVPVGVVSLSRLSVSFCSLSGPFPSLSAAPALTQLELAGNQFTQLPDLTNNTRLLSLTAGSNRLSSFPSGVVSLPDLSFLTLSNNLLSGPVPAWLSSLALPSLWWLDLSHNQLTGQLPDITWDPDWRIVSFIIIECNHFNTQTEWINNHTQPNIALKKTCYDDTNNTKQCQTYCNNTPTPAPSSSSSSSSSTSYSSTSSSTGASSGSSAASSSSSSSGVAPAASSSDSSSVSPWAAAGVGFAVGVVALGAFLLLVRCWRGRGRSRGADARHGVVNDSSYQAIA